MGDKIQHPKKRAFLAAYAKCGTIRKSAKIAKIDRTTHYAWMNDDLQYAHEFEEAKEDFIETLEEEADRRGSEGVEEIVFNKEGEQVGVKVKYSDTLLIFRLKALRPEVYRERHEYTTPQSELDEEITRRLAKVADRGKTPIPGTTGGGNGRSERNGRNGHAS